MGKEDKKVGKGEWTFSFLTTVPDHLLEKK
jgi:hypothetical protein